MLSVVPRRARLELDVDLAGAPITGELIIDGAPPRPFTGYAGLIAALEAILDDARLAEELAPPQYP
jgi:hypothetical protein